LSEYSFINEVSEAGILPFLTHHIEEVGESSSSLVYNEAAEAAGLASQWKDRGDGCGAYSWKKVVLHKSDALSSVR
jgi:hypothetical protein